MAYLDYVVGMITVASMELIARHKWQGWVLGLFNQTLWLMLLYQRELWGLILIPAILSWRYVTATRRWRREALAVQVAVTSAPS